MRKLTFWMGAASLGMACGGDGVDLPIPDNLEVVAATDAQRAPAGARLASPLAVIVRAEDGAVAPRGQVEWTVTTGTGASLSNAVTVADGTGRAEVGLTLGPATGSYAVRATLANNRNRTVEFTATATDPPQLTAVTPSTFTGGDIVQVDGTNLIGSVVLEFGATPARVLSVAGDGTSASAVVPICLVPGTIDLRARIDLAVSNTISGTYQASAAPVQLAVGDYASIDPAVLGGCATFPDAGVNGAEYLFAPQGVTGAPGVSAAYRLRGDSVVTVTVRQPRRRTPLPFNIRFHDMLRERERELALVPKPPLRQDVAPLAAAGPALGDRRNFRVCNVITCNQTGDFSSVTAEVKYVGEHAVIYQDLNAPSGGLSDADFMALGRTFDQDLYEVNALAFGAESDVDRNGRVVILMTPVVNGLTPTAECEAAVITGFFFALDVDPAFRNDERSNQAEVFYSLTADPAGSVTCAHSVERIRRLVPVTFTHELQHMISYYQHVLLGRGNSEVLWLNEAMSHLAEELAAFHFLALGDDTSFSRFAIGNLFNAFLYLQDPGFEFTLFGDGTGTLEERGAAWLFLRWVVDQFGANVVRRLSETPFTGAGNIENATGESIGPLLAQWFLANYVSDLPNFTPPARLRYDTWAFRTTYGSLNQQDPGNFDRPFPLVPDSVIGGTFELLGTLRSGSGDYLRVVQVATQRGFTLQFTDPGGGTIAPSVVPRLNVVRIR